MNLLAAEGLPVWVWIVIAVVAVVVIVAIIAAIAVANKKKAASPAREESAEAAPAVAEEPDEDEEIAADDEDAVDEAEEEEPSYEAPAAEVRTENRAQSAVFPAREDKKPVPANNKTYHISKRKSENKWQVKIAGGAKAIKLFNTQYEAIDFAKKLAENQEAKIVIHKEDGTFRRLTYHKKK